MTQAGLIDSRSQVQMVVSNVVQLVNEGDTEFNMRYGPTKRLVLAPGQSLFVPEEIAWHYLGKWWTDNANPRVRERLGEVQRLRTLFGAYEDDVVWEANRPRLVAYAPDGKRITTVVDDPDGVEGGTFTQLGKELSLESQLNILQDTVLALQGQIAANSGAAVPEPTAQVDTPAPTTGLITPGNQAPANFGGVSVPVSPPPFIELPDDPMEAVGPGTRLTVQPAVIHDPSEEPAPEDAPRVVPNGASITGGRIAAE